MTLPAPPAEEARLRRGEKLRQTLLDLIERTDPDGGGWPDRLEIPPGGRPNLVYTRPEEPSAPRPGQDAREISYNQAAIPKSTVVLHEPPEEHPDGVWVGYADGHLEFAASAADLAACKGQLRILRAAIDAYGNPYGRPPESEVDEKAVAAHLKGGLTLRLLDPGGRPVAGASVGTRGRLRDGTPPDDRVHFYDTPKLVSDADGRVRIPVERVFTLKGVGSGYLNSGSSLYVLHEGRGLVALEELRVSEFGGEGKGERTREVRLHPACRVSGEVTSLGLRDLGQTVGQTSAFAFKPGYNWIRAVFCTSSRPHFELLLPHGEYGIYVGASGHDPVYRYIHIEPNRREYALRVDLCPRVLPDRLVGRPAPELRKIKGWKNGGPVRLAELPGKVVLLDFWGHWCGPCIASMPHLMALHDKYKDRGLVVLAVHDDSVESVEEMDRKLRQVRQDVWSGRDLPFLVALDGGGQTRVKGTGRFVSGATTAAYLVNVFPTTVLVGRDGTVARDVKLYDREAHGEIEKLIEELLNAEASPTP